MNINHSIIAILFILFMGMSQFTIRIFLGELKNDIAEIKKILISECGVKIDE